MRLTNQQIWEGHEPLQELLKQPMELKLAYALTKLARQANEQYSLIEQVRTKLVTQYGKELKPGQIVVQNGTPDWDKFAAAFSELMSVEVDLAAKKIVLPLSADLRLAPSTLMALEPFVDVT